MPGHENTRSTKTAPVSNAGSMTPVMEITGNSAARQASRRTAGSDSPLARAVRTKGSVMLSCIASRW